MAVKSGGSGRFLVILVAIAAAGGFALWQSTRRGDAGTPVAVPILPADTAGFRGYVLGSPDAPVEIVEYADYQCPACQVFEVLQFPDVKSRLIETGRVRWVYRDFPLDNIHPHARLAAHAAACAEEQGKYWEMHTRIYAAQPDWSRLANAGGAFRDLAGDAGLDGGRFRGCMSAGRYQGRIEASAREGVRLGVGSTPTLIIGGRRYEGAQPYDRIRALVDSIAPVATVPAAPAPATP